MESEATKVEEMFVKIREYIEVRIELLRLKSVNKTAGFMSSAITLVILIIIFSGTFICITIGASFLIGDWLGRTCYGFFIVGAVYLIAGLVMYSMRDKWIKKKVSNKLIKDLMD
jgi:hypothetical protein